MEIVNKAKNFLGNVKNYWKTPPEGRYMSFKEIVSLSVGGIGVKFIVYCIGQLVISVGNSMLGNTIGLLPTTIYWLYIISVVSNIPLTAVRSDMIDNTRSMKGKYRPYIITMGIPTVLLGIGFIMAPYENMQYITKCVVILLFNIGFQFFYNFYTDAYDSILNVLSPNSIERSDVFSIKSIIENLSPSIANIFLPIVANAITGENTLYDIKIYRVLFPPMLVAGFFISMLVYVNTEEKIIRAKTHVIRVKFIDAFRAVARNKYFWIISLAGWLGFLEGSFGSIIGWLYSYQSACSPVQYSIITAIAGNASLWPNIIAPFAVRKYGKRKILIVTNLLNIVLIALMLPVVRMTGHKGIIWALLFFTFVNTFISAMGHLLGYSINADIRDYQQYISGERIDGMFAAVGLIGSIITLATSSVLPVIYERTGLNTATALALGYDGSNVYDVLYNTEFFINICSVLIIASVIGATLNVIPFFFFDLTETKQKAMISVLKIRAMFEDYGNNVVSEDKLREGVAIIKEAREFAGMQPHAITKDMIKQARATGDKAKVKASKEEYNRLRDENEKIEIANIILEELERFETQNGKDELEIAERIYSFGIDGFLSADIPSKSEIKRLPKTTQQEKDHRRNLLMTVSKMNTAKKAVKKYFANGIVAFDNSVFETLFKEEDDAEVAVHDCLLRIKAAKEAKDEAAVVENKIKLKELKAEKRIIAKKIKKATDENSVYYRATQPYIDAGKLITQYDNYTHLDELMSAYGDEG